VRRSNTRLLARQVLPLPTNLSPLHCAIEFSSSSGVGGRALADGLVFVLPGADREKRDTERVRAHQRDASRLLSFCEARP